MPSATNRLLALVFLLLTLGFFALMYALIALRFGGGDVYPAYSSLRADPKGAKALFESLSGLEEVQVAQNFDRWETLHGDPKTIFVLGVDPFSDAEDVNLLTNLSKLAAQGHRVILGFEPVLDWSSPLELPAASSDSPKEEPPSSDGPSPEPEAPSSDGPNPEPEATEFQEVSDDEFQWGFDREILVEVEPENSPFDRNFTELVLPAVPLPVSLAWRSTLYFTDIDPAWRVIYRHMGEPVLLERIVGSGSMVILGDCFELSNEALWQDAEPKYVAWLIGANTQIVFNETQLGLRAQTNLMGLIRRFRLHGVLFGLLVLAVLFVWKQSSSLVPPRDSEKTASSAGQHAASGLIHLLTRGVPPARLIQTCVAQWRETLKVHEPHLVSREKKVATLVDEAASGNQQPQQVVAQYNQIQEVVSTRSTFR